MENLTFNELPEAVTQLFDKLEAIERLLQEQRTGTQPETPVWFDLTQLCDYLPDKPALATVYGYVHARKIPFHKGAKKLRFLKSEIDTWLLLGRNKTVTEISAEADTYIKRKGQTK
jgi:hypothetical protein